MMSSHILYLGWPPYFDHKDTYCIKFASFNLLWGVRYKHLCEFSDFQKCDNYVKTPKMCEFFCKTRSPSQAKNIFTCQKSVLGVLQFLQSILYI